MPKRNLVWLLVVASLCVGLWVYPSVILRLNTLHREFGALLDVRAQIKKNYVEEVRDDALLSGAIRGMLRELDPFSDYFDTEEYAQFKKRASGHFVGIGVEVSIVGGYLTVISPIEDTPAFAAGLRSGDRILEVDGHSTQDFTLSEAVARISGEAGTTVRLKIWSLGDDEPHDVTITRGLVTLTSVKGHRRRPDNSWDYMVDPPAGIGYVRLTAFDENTREQLDRALQALYPQGLRALIIDLRDNPGGLLKTAVGIADRFLNEGVIVSTKGRAADEEVWSATPSDDYPWELPIAILINNGSASAAEILAGALRDHGKAVLVGQTTFGKGSVQRLFEMNEGKRAIKLTTAYYYLPRGERIHKVGVKPDFEVRLTPEEQRSLSPEAQLPATTRAATEPTTRPAVRDRQLEKAIAILRENLGMPPAPTTTAASTRPATTRSARLEGPSGAP